MRKDFVKALLEDINGKMVAVASDETVDRHGDSLSLDSWDLKNFKRNPVLQFAHDYSLPPVGLCKNIKKKDGKLIFEPVFHEFTQLARDTKKLYEEGIMKAFSVGFISKEKEKGVMSFELLEISAVPVPANPEALILEKSMKAVVKDEQQLQIKEWIESETNDNIIEAEEKVGKVLSKKTRSAIEKAKIALDELLKADSGSDTDDEKEIEIEEVMDDIELKEEKFKNIKGRDQSLKKEIETINSQVGYLIRKLKK